MPVFIRGGGGKTPKLQSKVITPTASAQYVMADGDYDALKMVTVNGVLQYKKISRTMPADGDANDWIFDCGDEIDLNRMPSAIFFAATNMPENTATCTAFYHIACTDITESSEFENRWVCNSFAVYYFSGNLRGQISPAQGFDFTINIENKTIDFKLPIVMFERTDSVNFDIYFVYGD
ncbi:MAG: hypothetical protein ACI4N6_02500 [Eubacteriales bacterium]